MKLILSLIFFSLNSFAGTEMGNGGDAVLQAFNLRGMQIGLYLKSEIQVAQKHGIDPDKFLGLVKKVSLEAKDQLLLNGIEVDAISYPSIGKIQVSRSRWATHTKDPNAFLVQRRIALHEYLWMYGIDDSNYVVSNPIIAHLESQLGSSVDPEVRRFLQNKVCEAVRVLDLAKVLALLTWGLDLNEKCHLSAVYGKDYWSFPAEVLAWSKLPYPAIEDAGLRLKMGRELFMKGMSPNAQDSKSFPFLFDVMGQDFELGKMAIEFGADVNAQTPRATTVFVELADEGFDFPTMDVKRFDALIEAGGDVNKYVPYFKLAKSAARVIVSRLDNAAVVEALILTGKVDWCTPTQTNRQKRTIDSVLPEYLPLLQKYKVSCP